MTRLAVVFRVDSGTAIGSGHLVRCLTLATELRRRGADVRFISREHRGHLINDIERDGYAVHRLRAPKRASESPDHRSLGSFGASQEDDAAETAAALVEQPTNWLIVDHYDLDALWEGRVRSLVGGILAIDDLANRFHVCDTLLDQNWLGSETGFRYDALVPESTLRLLGPRFALLQAEYAERRKAMTPRDGKAKRIVLFFGATDSSDESAKALDALSSPEYSDLTVDVVLGRNHPNPDGIKARVKARQGAACYEDLGSLAALLSSADVAGGGGGTTTWERLCLDLPSIVTTLAPNQEAISKVLADQGYIKWIGSAAETTVETYRRAFAKPPRSSLDLPPLVDGLGAKRVAETIIPSGAGLLKLRRARHYDDLALFEWRNDPLTRSMSFGSEPVMWKAHCEWFCRKLADPRVTLLVLEADGLPVGQIRLDSSGVETTVSYTVDRLVRGRGWGAWMVARAMELSGLQVLKAEVKASNEASRRIFARLGWKEEQGSYGNIIFRFDP